MKNVLFISEKEIKVKSKIEQNVNSKELSLTIQSVQEIQLKDIIGVELYNTLIDEAYKVATDVIPYTMSVANKKLIDEYIKPFLLHATVVDFIVNSSYTLSNKGVLKLNDNSANNINPNDTEYLKNYHDNNMAVYKRRLIEYLNTNDQTVSKTDANITSHAIGWHLETNDYCRGYGGLYPYVYPYSYYYNPYY